MYWYIWDTLVGVHLALHSLVKHVMSCFVGDRSPLTELFNLTIELSDLSHNHGWISCNSHFYHKNQTAIRMQVIHLTLFLFSLNYKTIAEELASRIYFQQYQPHRHLPASNTIQHRWKTSITPSANQQPWPDLESQKQVTGTPQNFSHHQTR